MARANRWKTKNHLKTNVMMYAVLYNMEMPDVAKSIKMATSTLYQHLSKPSNVRLGTLEKLAKLFNCWIEDLIYPKLNS